MLRAGSLCGVAVFLAAASANAQAIRTNTGFFANDLGPTDDGSTGAIPLGFHVTYFGGDFGSVYVNNNGYIAFDEQVTTLFSATKLDQRLLGVYFADVDTRGDAGTSTLHYGADTVNGRAAFAATWPGVGYYERHDDKLDVFQIVLVDRDDTGAGHFDVEFNYGTITWDSGDRSDGSVEGLGGWPSAIVGYSDGVTPTLFPGSGAPGTFLDGNPETGLVHGQSQSGVPGRYVFEFRQAPVPDAGTPAEAGVPQASLEVAPSGDPRPPTALGCACKIGATEAGSGGSSVLLACGGVGALLRRRRSHALVRITPRPRGLPSRASARPARRSCR